METPRGLRCWPEALTGGSGRDFMPSRKPQFPTGLRERERGGLTCSAGVTLAAHRSRSSSWQQFFSSRQALPARRRTRSAPRARRPSNQVRRREGEARQAPAAARLDALEQARLRFRHGEGEPRRRARAARPGACGPSPRQPRCSRRRLDACPAADEARRLAAGGLGSARAAQADCEPARNPGSGPEQDSLELLAAVAPEQPAASGGPLRQGAAPQGIELRGAQKPQPPRCQDPQVRPGVAGRLHRPGRGRLRPRRRNRLGPSRPDRDLGGRGQRLAARLRPVRHAGLARGSRPRRPGPHVVHADDARVDVHAERPGREERPLPRELRHADRPVTQLQRARRVPHPLLHLPEVLDEVGNGHDGQPS